MKIMKSAEDYLEAMLMMREKHGYIRSVDIAGQLGVSKPSVSYATKRLRENGYIDMAEDGRITLLPQGLEIAQRIYERHMVLTRLFMDLGVDEKTAADDACKVEHDLSETTFAAIKAHTQRLAGCRTACPEKDTQGV